MVCYKKELNMCKVQPGLALVSARCVMMPI